MQIFLDIMTIFWLAFGLVFMSLGVVGLLRLPDLYHRMHAATKGVTLGITGLLIAAAFNLSTHPDATVTGIVTRFVLVIAFQFVANPVGSHMLAKAGHMAGVPMWEGVLSDELQEDRDAA
ncbi:MAG: Na+/H+ antiporter subunit G [Phycisphaera sp.]|nr:Na+/H+ antiporter subunit G [Phycisphaera sp.]